MATKATAAKLLSVCNLVLDARAAGHSSVAVNGVTFDLTEVGMCQRNVRKVYEATTGHSMPGVADNAWHSFQNLRALGEANDDFCPGWWLGDWDAITDDLRPGDIVYMSTGGGVPGHVGVWMGVHDGDEWMFQNTSRKGEDGEPLGTTREGLTDTQKTRVVGAFRLVPLT